MKTYEELYTLAKEHNQEHIFRFYDELTTNEQEELLSQINTIDFAFIKDIYTKGLEKQQAQDYSNIQAPKTIIKADDNEANFKAIETGKQAIKEGKVALFTLAGGQGSRLGFNGPKGCFEISPVKKKTLYQLFAQRLLATNKQYDTELDWYIMTSDATHEDTTNYFQANNYFGLNKEKIVFFKQRMLPQVNEEGKLLIKNKHSLVLGPDGTGGVYNALVDNNITSRMKEQKITCFMLTTVDNPLTQGIDPMYLGHHLNSKAEYSVKVTKKTDPEEKVGHVVERDGKNQMIEYIHLSTEQAHLKKENGDLVFSAGNILNDIINVDFVEKIEQKNLLPYLAAHKKCNYLNETGELVEAQEPNSYKFERFIFDALPLAKISNVFEVKREEEFAPVKNATGKDSPQTAKELQTELYRSWLAGVIEEERLLSRPIAIEVSPLFALDRETFVKKTQFNLAKTIEKLDEDDEVYFG